MKAVRPSREPSDEAEARASACAATSIRLTAGQLYFLDRFRARVARDTGCRISRTQLLQVLVDAVGTAQPDLRDVTSEADLTRRLCEASGRRPDPERS